jgi:hypothetical protein
MHIEKEGVLTRARAQQVSQEPVWVEGIALAVRVRV